MSGRRPIQLRCLNPGGRAQDLLGPFITEVDAVGFFVERVFTVGDEHIYGEMILPPVVTMYISRADLSEASPSVLASVALSLAHLLARFVAADITGYGAPPEKVEQTNDAGVFVEWDDQQLVRYYFKSGAYDVTALATIPATFANILPRLRTSHSSLADTLFWIDGRWHWFDVERRATVPV